jgi:hypothetical protein
VVALLASALLGGSGSERLRALTVLLALPTGARYLTGGGDDIAVLALLLLAVALEHRRRPVAAGAVIGLAAAIKLTAWLPLPFLALAARDHRGRRASGRFLAAPVPHAKGILAAALAAIVVAVGALLLLRRPAAHPRAAAEQASLVFTLTVLLATAGRPGYLIYPLNLLVWSRLLGPDDDRPAAPVGGVSGARRRWRRSGCRPGRPRRATTPSRRPSPFA